MQNDELFHQACFLVGIGETDSNVQKLTDFPANQLNLRCELLIDGYHPEPIGYWK